ncbi:hypothetical protein XELAEV_18006340mg [Xenopus laevis]|uniref:Uncharacterized protein n=1 Tax=Xenopus laevis TaxID=8355 RepID=A0A974I483_XENLA|nr:hypothetical protein XELAEV_18006340mg [Xenopus laevis]
MNAMPISDRKGHIIHRFSITVCHHWTKNIMGHRTSIGETKAMLTNEKLKMYKLFKKKRNQNKLELQLHRIILQ